MAKDKGRQLVPREMLGGFEGTIEGLRVGEEFLEDPAVEGEVGKSRKALVVTFATGLATFAVPAGGNAGALVSDSGNEIVEWPDVETTEPNAEPARRVALPGVEGVNIVAVTNGRVVTIASGDGWDSRRIFVIEDIGGELSITDEVPVPEMTGLFGYPEVAPDGTVLIPNGDILWRFNPTDGTVVPILDGNGEQLITSVATFEDEDGQANALAIGQTPGSDADYLYHICKQGGEDVVTSYSFGTGSWESPYGPRITNVELSDTKMVLSDPGAGTVVSVDFNMSDTSTLAASLETPTGVMSNEDFESAARYAGHNDTGYYIVMEDNGEVHSFGKDVSARDTLNIGDDINEVVPAGGDTYLVRTGEGIVEVNGATREIVRTIQGVGGGVNAVVPSSPEVAALLYAPVYNEVHVAADSAYTIAADAEPSTVSATLNLEAMIESGEPAEFSSLTVDATTFEHTIIINFGFDDIVLTGFGTAVKVTVSIVDGRVKLTAKVLKDGRLGNSSASLNGGERIYEHPDSSAGETEEQTIDLGPVESFTGDDDTGGQTDDDDAGQLDDDDTGEVQGGCADADCSAGAGSSDGAAPLAVGGIAGWLLWARRKRRRTAA